MFIKKEDFFSSKRLLFAFTIIAFAIIEPKIFAKDSKDFTINSGEYKENQGFYNEKNDLNDKNQSRKYKNYAKIGSETYSQTNIWLKPYIGIDINWYLKRFGDDYNSQIFYSNFWIRFQNLDIYGGLRLFKHFGTEVGYVHLGNSSAKDGRKHVLNGIFASALFYSPMLDLKYTTIESYLSVGGAMLFSGINDGKPDFGGKFGCGLMFQIYGPVTANLGVEYYYPFSSYTKKGFLAFKTGVNLYFDI